MIRLAIVLLVLCASISCSYSGTPTGFVTQTTGVLHVYADGTSGNDAWDGSAAAQTPGTLIGPKKTLQAVFDLIPFRVAHNTCVHLAGTFTDWGLAYLIRYVELVATLLIDGGTALTIVDDNGGVNYTDDIHSASSIGLTTAGWAVDAYAGYLVEMVSGVCSGQHRMIVANTSTTLTPAQNFSGDPGAGAQFRISRPATTFSASVTTSKLGFGNLGQGSYRVQNLYLTGTKAQIITIGGTVGTTTSAVPNLSHVISNAAWANAAIFSGGVLAEGERYNNVTFSREYGSAYSNAGFGLIPSAGKITANDYLSVTLYQTFATQVLLQRGDAFAVNVGSRIKSLQVAGVDATNLNAAMISTTAGYATTTLNYLRLVDSTVRIGAGVSVSDSSTHGIEVNHGRVHLDGAVTGTGNTGAGVYAHSGSVVHIKNGAAPTLTGTVGNLSFDGTTEASTWAAIDAGTKAVDLSELSLAKEVP